MQNKLYKKILFCILALLLLFSFTGCKQSKILRYRDEAIEKYKAEDYEEALNLIDSSLNIGNGEVGDVQYDLLLYKADCLIRLGRPYEAREIYEVLVKIDKRNKDYQALYNQINNVLSLVDFQKALDEDRISDAIALYDNIKALGLDHERSVLFNRAVLYEKQGKWKDAENAFNIYLNEYPDDEDCKREIKFIKAQMGRED